MAAPLEQIQPKDILLGTLNSTYQHSSFGLRYLYANMQELQPQTHVIEWTIKENSRNIVEQILAYKPKIMGLSVYIWNTEEMFEVLSMLKTVAPEIVVVLGGPEISYETETQRLFPLCDYVITGEADHSFREFCQTILKGEKPETKIIRSILPDIKSVLTPYHLYTDDDIKNRVIYVEASRGCPYKCEYCLSSLDKSVRNFDTEHFLKSIDGLMDRGARTFKFVDRTFNLSPTTSTAILKYFLTKIHLGLFLHFEMVPDRLPQEIKDLIVQFPLGSLQFEVGIQTLNPEVAVSVSRKNDLVKVRDNFQFILEHTKIHTHADLIVGLPGETIESFGAGFDRLSQMGPDEIQVGILKRLKGTPIIRHETQFKMIYQKFAPFQIISTSTMSYSTLQKMNRFAKFWDLYANSGEFKNLMLHLKKQEGSLFWNFMGLVEFLNVKYSETHSISLMSLCEQAWNYLQQELHLTEEIATEIIVSDYCSGYKKRDLPPFLKKKNHLIKRDMNSLNSRQLKHQVIQS
ncbi:MAG: DUF4080 domain-containing protein [Bdellovibrionaceae bacterium]|nr:DUF4080 domain-containing protein [Pseudobdellovibrionaceae bacterium]